MTRILKVGSSRDEREAADYFTRMDFLAMLDRFEADIRTLSPEAKADFANIRKRLERMETMQ